MAVAMQSPPWSELILEQLAETDVPETAAWAVVHVPPDGEGHPYIVEEGFSATQTGAAIVAEDFASSCGGGEVVTVKLADLQAAAEEQHAFETSGADEPEPTPETEPAAMDPLERASNMLTNRVADLVEEAAPGTFGDERLPEGAGPEHGALFDSDAYIESITFDDQDADALKISFAGSVALDLTSPSDRKLFEGLRLGRPVTLKVHGRVARKVGGWKEDAEGAIVVTGTAGVKIDSLLFDTPVAASTTEAN